MKKPHLVLPKDKDYSPEFVEFHSKATQLARTLPYSSRVRHQVKNGLQLREAVRIHALDNLQEYAWSHPDRKHLPELMSVLQDIFSHYCSDAFAVASESQPELSRISINGLPHIATLNGIRSAIQSVRTQTYKEISKPRSRAKKPLIRI